MRGADEQPGSMFNYISLEDRLPADHRLRAIRRITDRALERASILCAVAILIGTLLSACDSPTTPTPTPTPAPTPMPAPGITRYHVSGIVTDENGLRIANAFVAVRNDLYFGVYKRTSTDGAGYYEVDYESDGRSAGGTGGIFGLVYAGRNGEYEFSTQLLPSGAAEIVKNVRLRRVQTINAGQSTTVLIEPDSSLAWDDDDWMDRNSVWEKLHVRVPAAGTLTIEARAEAGGSGPSLLVLCIYVTDNCGFEWVKAPAGSGTGSLKVQADSLFEVRVAIRTPALPQRYVVSTSLQTADR
jgi:hypothetical protein